MLYWLSAVAIALTASVHGADKADDEEPLHLQVIVVASRSQAERLRASLANGADFAETAKKESIDPAAAAGGDLGIVRRSTLRGELQQATRALRPGEVSDVVAVPTGYAIVKVVPAGAPPSRPSRPSRPLLEAADAPPADGFAIAGAQFSNVRYPPYTTGISYVEGLFRMMPKPPGVNDDPALFCAAHQATLDIAIERLQTLVTSEDPAVQAKATPNQVMQAHYMWGILESYQGHMERAIQQWEEAYRISRADLPDNVSTMEEVLGAAYLHQAEMKNGLYDHPDDRCLFPPPPQATHAKFEKTEDSRKAIEYLTRYLERKPDEPEVRWLLNVAYMTLGQYPEGVPERHRLAPSLFASKQDVGRFLDVAATAGLATRPFVSAALAVDDFDGDGRLDVVTSSYDPCEHVYYFHNDGDGTFSDRSEAAGLTKVAGAQGIVQADYDNDGCLDMLLLRGAWQAPLPLSLLHNNCDGTFTDVTRAAGLRDSLYQTQTAAWADIDNDGKLDLFIGNEIGPSHLFHNEGGGTFKNVSTAAGIGHTFFVKGVVAEDYDNDGYIDFFVSNIRGSGNQLFHNNHDGTFTDVAQKAGVNESTASFTTWFFDYDNDGWPDLFVATDYASIDETMRTYLGLPRNTAPSKLFHNLGNGTFKDVAVASGLDNGFMPMGANFGDVDGDGYLDIYLGTGAPDYGSMAPKVLFRNDGGRTFVDVTTASGTGELHKMHGIAFADMENRGQQDIVASMGGAAPGDAHALRLFRNPGHDTHWVDVKLVGVKANRAGIGARITVTVETPGGGTRSIYRTVNSGGSFGSSPLAQSIGLGKSTRIARLEVLWPGSQTPQTFRNVPVDRFIEVKQGAPTYARLERKQYRLGATSASASPSPDRAAP